MAPGIVALSAGVVFSAAAVLAQSSVTTFDLEKPGAPPAGFAFASWRQPSAGAWTVRRQGPNGYLGHDPMADAAGYSIALAAGPSRRDLQASVRLRLSGGSRAGGLIWRYQDDQHYYAAVLDLGRREVTLWRVSAGSRVVLEIEDDLELDPEAWHTLKVVHDEDEIRVSLGGIRVFEDADRRGSRLIAAGRAGVIAKGDAAVWFDDLRLDEERRGR